MALLPLQILQHLRHPTSHRLRANKHFWRALVKKWSRRTGVFRGVKTLRRWRQTWSHRIWAQDERLLVQAPVLLGECERVCRPWCVFLFFGLPFIAYGLGKTLYMSDLPSGWPRRSSTRHFYSHPYTHSTILSRQDLIHGRHRRRRCSPVRAIRIPQKGNKSSAPLR